MKKAILLIGLLVAIVALSGCVNPCDIDNSEGCDRSCDSDGDCKWACPIGCINKSQYFDDSGVQCEMPSGDCKCIDNQCTFEWQKPPIGCPEDAKLCPDGTTVVRNPALNCEFDPCPCVGEGDSIGLFTEQECCPGLENIGTTTLCPNGSCDGDCALPAGSGGRCSDCGNRTCEEWEDKCTCSADCLVCEEGYTRTMVPYLTPKSESYCKIDKVWEDFETCAEQADCQEEGYECIAQIDSEDDFRCIPSQHYLLDCWCLPDSGCLCT